MSLKSIKVIDLFSGAGGLSSGFRQAGFNICGSIESIKIYSATHEINFPSCKSICSDIRQLTPSRFEKETKINRGEPIIIIGGPPCQTFSNAGQSKIRSIAKDISKDHRNFLFNDLFKYVKYFEPEMFLMENVPNLQSRYGGQVFESILRKAKKLRYSVSHEVLDASDFGVPQKRKRLFIVGSRNSTDYKFPSPSRKKTATTVFDAISDLPKIYDGIRADDLPYSKNTGLTSYQKKMRNNGSRVGNNICRVSNDRAKKLFPYMKQGDKYVDLPPSVRKILPFRVDIFPDRLKRLVLDEPSWTILAHIGMDGYRYIHPTENRTLSVREAARIQSFPDNFKFVGNMREQYIQVGNSVPPLLAKALAKSIRNCL